MEFFKATRLLTSIIVCEVAGAIGSFFTAPQISGWYKTLNRPSFNPPNWIFGPVWTAIFVMMGIAVFLVWDKKWGGKKTVNILVFFSQLFLNVLWSFIFFAMHNVGVAFFELVVLWFVILFMVINFYKVSKTAAILLLPYILWVSFAAVLNFSIWKLN